MAYGQFKAVIFDLDNTLYPESQYVLSGCRAVARYVRKLYSLDIHDEMVEFYNSGEKEFIAAALQKHYRTVEPLLIQKLKEIYRCHFPHLDLHPDARICLALLSSARLKKALVTDGQGYVQRCKVDSLGLRPLLDSVVFSDDLGGEEYWKPSPDPFFIMGLQLELEPEQMIFVGSNPRTDFIAPLQLGMGTIMVQRESSVVPPNNIPPDKAPRVVISSLEHILSGLQALTDNESSLNPAAKTENNPEDQSTKPVQDM